MINELLTIQDLQKILKIKKTKIYSLIKHGELASPLKIGSRSLWLYEDIQSYILSLRCA